MMKTSELIAVLAQSEPVRPAAPARRLMPAALIGAAVALALLLVTLGLQPLAPAMRASWFWMKAGYGLAAALAGALLLVPLARPGARLGAAWLAVLAVAVLAISMMAMHQAMRAAPGQEAALWLGWSWRVCSLRIAGLAVPIWLALILALRRLAPTRLALTGAAAGLMAGGLAAAVYGLWCEESAAPFVAVWYSAGVAIAALAGALAGRRLLRW
jgi:hypothetical protein